MGIEQLLQRIDIQLERLKLSARAASLRAGMSSDFIRDLHRKGKRFPPADVLNRLAEAIGASPEYLLETMNLTNDFSTHERPSFEQENVHEVPPSTSGAAYEGLLQAIERGRRERNIPSERTLLKLANVGEKTIYHIRMGHAPKPDNIRRIANVIGCQVSYLLDLATQGAPDPRLIPLVSVYIMGHVQAGIWREAVEWPNDEWYAVSVPSDGRFPGATRFGLEVRGRSMDRLYPPGTIVLVVKFADLGRGPKPRERVMVYRRSRQSGEFEATLKEYDIDEDGRHILWPRSTAPEFQSPIVLEDLTVSSDSEISSVPGSSDNGNDVFVTALVVGSYRPE